MKIIPSNMRFTPVFILSATSIIALVFAAMIIFLTINTPWMGLELRANLEENSIEIVSVAADGPSKDLETIGKLIRISSLQGEPIKLEAQDLLEEPDVLPSFEDMYVFIDRQHALSILLNQSGLELTVEDANGNAFRHNIVPTLMRPISDLPVVFWAQLLVALAGFVIGSWVFLLRPTWPSAFFAIVGVGLAIAAGTASIYSVRELAIDGGLFDVLSRINHIGGTLFFGFGMIALFLNYPRKLMSKKYLLILIFITSIWQIADQARMFESAANVNHLWVAIQMLIIIILVGVQYVATKGDPRGRATLLWLGLSAIAGTGAFVLVTILPILLGITQVVSQGYAFLLFLIIYIGVALGVSRYKLFELDEWAFKIMFYLAGAALLVGMDAVLILVLAFDDLSAFSLSVLSVGLLYLPFRDNIGRLFMRRKTSSSQDMFNEVVDIAYVVSVHEQKAQWQGLMQRLFNPLVNEFIGEKVEEAHMVSDGLEIRIPAVPPLAALKLEYAHAGRKLFTRSNVARAEELVSMLNHVIENRNAHEKGVREERQRIARDMHDNIGAQLLSALHSKKPERKDVMIRETITDLRDIINDASSQDLTFDEVLADLRVETAERLATAHIELNWAFKSDDTPPLDAIKVHTLRSIIREVVSNVIKHADAKNLYVTWDWANQEIVLHLCDDGKGIDDDDATSRAGLTNIEARTQSLNGTFLRLPNDPGACFEIKFPI